MNTVYKFNGRSYDEATKLMAAFDRHLKREYPTQRRVIVALAGPGGYTYPAYVGGVYVGAFVPTERRRPKGHDDRMYGRRLGPRFDWKPGAPL